MKAGTWILLAVLALGSLLVVTPAASFVGDRIEWKEIEVVQNGIDAGEIETIPGMACHWGNGYYWGGPPNIGYRSERYADASGEPIIPPDNVIQTSIGMSFTVNDPENPSHDRCFESTPLPAFRTRGYPNPDEPSNEGRFNWEVKLESAACQPGYYRLTMSWGDSPNYVFERKFGVELAQIVPCTILVKDQDGQPIQGAVAHTVTLGDYTIGPTNSAGLAAQNMPTGLYSATLTAPNCQGQNITLDHDTDTGTIPITMQRFANPPTEAGKVELTVVDKTTGAVIAGAEVHCGTQTMNTGADGKVMLDGLPGTRKATVHKTGYMGGSVDVRFDKSVTRKLRIKLSPLNPDGTGDPPEVDDNSGEDPGFWESLFVPKQETMQGFADLYDTMVSWGPFGAFTKFLAAWHADNVDGEIVPLFEWHMPFMAGSQTALLDLRETRETPYADGTNGTAVGNIRALFRKFVGMMAWVLFGLAFWRWLRPRMSA